MSDRPPANKPLNRLRAAEGIISHIEAGMADGSISHQRVCELSEFCLWVLEHHVLAGPEDEKLVARIEQGLERIKARLELGPAN